MPGKIKVKILAGRNLPVMDRSGDTTDAYVEIKFGNTTYKTDVCRKSLNPQWNSEWYRFEVDDAELQDEPLQVRLMDHDTYSANDAIGKVYVNLNPLLLPGSPLAVKNIWTLEATMNSSSGSQGGSVMTGWIPVFDTMHGIRGEVNIIVKVELFSDCNKFRQSSCGVQFFYSPNIPHGYHAQVIHGFVEELVVSDDPEYKWIDKIRTPRASNEARQTLFFKLSGEVQRKIGLKALDLGGNAVIGYVQNFDLEGESGIVARGIGTAVTLVKLQDIASIIPLENSNIEDLTFFGLQSKNSVDFSESDDSIPLLSHSPNLTPVPRSPVNIRPTTIGKKFPNYEKSSRETRQKIRIAEYRAAGMRARQFSLQSTATSPTMRKAIGSSLSLAEDLISESSLRNMLALEDMRGEPAGNPFSRGLKNFRYLHQSILPKRVAQIKSRITDSFDDESDPESNYSSTWSLAGSESNRSSITDIRQSIRRKKFTHKKASNEGMAALLIRSVHSGFPLDSVIEDRETPAPSPVNFLTDSIDHGDEDRSSRIEDKNGIDKSDKNIAQIVEKLVDAEILIGKTKIPDYTNDIAIPMMSSSESDTSTSEDDEPSESSTNYNILDETYSLIDPSSLDDGKYVRNFESPLAKFNESKNLTLALSKSLMNIDKPLDTRRVLEIIRGNDENSSSNLQHNYSLQSSTDYNILDDTASLIETNFSEDQKIDVESQLQKEASKIEDDVSITPFENVGGSLRIIEDEILGDAKFSLETGAICNFHDDAQSLVEANSPEEEKIHLEFLRCNEASIITENLNSGDLIVSENVKKNEKSLGNYEDSEIFEEIKLSEETDIVVDSNFLEDVKIATNLQQIDDRPIFLVSSTPDLIPAIFLESNRKSSRNEDTRIDMSMLADSFDDETFSPIFQTIDPTDSPKDSVALISSTNQIEESLEKMEDEGLSIEENSFLQQNENFDSSTDYNVLEDIYSSMKSFDEERFEQIGENANFSNTEHLNLSSQSEKINETSSNVNTKKSANPENLFLQPDEKLDSSMTYNVLEDNYSMFKSNTFDEESSTTFQQTRRNLPEVEKIYVDNDSMEKKSSSNENSAPSDGNFDSSTDYNVLEDTGSLIATSSLDDDNFTKMFNENVGTTNYSEIDLKNDLISSLHERKIDKITILQESRSSIDEDFSPPFSKDPKNHSTREENIFDHDIAKSPPKLKHLKFLPKQKHFDSVEDLGFVTSTPVETKTDPFHDFSPTEKSPGSLKSNIFEYPQKLDPEESPKKCDASSEATDTKKLAKDKQICPLGVPFDKVTTIRDSKTLEKKRECVLNDSAKLLADAAKSKDSSSKGSLQKKVQKKVERTDTVIYKGPAKNREGLNSSTLNRETSVKSSKKSARPTSPIPIIVAPPPEENATRLQVPVIQTTNINVQSTFSPDEMKTQHFGSIGSRKFPLDECVISEKFGRKFRQNCMLDLIKTIDTKMMTHHGHHDRRDSTKSKQRKKRERINASATPSPDSIHRTRQHRKRSRSRSPEKQQHSHARGQVSPLTTHSFPAKTSSTSISNLQDSQSRHSCENISRSNSGNAMTFPKVPLTISIDDKTNTGTNEESERPKSPKLIVSEVNPETVKSHDLSVAKNNHSVIDETVTIDIVDKTMTMSLLTPKESDKSFVKSHSDGSLECLRECSSFVTNNTNESNKIDVLCVPCPQLTLRQNDEEPSSPVQQQSAILPSSLGSKVTTNPTAVNKTSGTTVLPNMHRRSSDSDLSITPKGNSLAGSDRSMGGHLRPSTAIVRTMNQDTMEMLEYPFITMQQYPPGFVLNIGGLVSARSVKLLERITNLEEPEGRDAWWTEIRMEVRSHARALACNVVLGYKEEISICDDVCVLNASGTAAVINLINANQDQENVLLSRTIMTTSVESERDKSQVKGLNPKIEKSEEIPQSVTTSGKLKRTSESNDHEIPYLPTLSACSLCHLPYSEASVPFRVDVSKCAICRRAKVPDVLFTTIELPENIPMTGRGVFLQATVCKCKRDLRGELNAKEISDCLPFLEYELHSLLLNKLKVKGMNAIFGLKVQVSVGERLVIGMAVGTAVYLTALPTPSVPQIASGNSWHNEEQLADIQKTLIETVKKNREFYRLKPIVEIENGRSITTSDTDESDDDLPDLDLGIGSKDACVLEVDDVEDMDRINLLIDEKPPEDFHVVNTQSIPGLEDLEIVRNLQMFTQISRAKIPAGQFASMPSKYFARMLQTVLFKLRRMVPCALCDMQFRVALPEQDEIQLSVVGMALGLGEPTRFSKYKRKIVPNSTSKDPVKKTDEADLIFSLDEDQVENTNTSSQEISASQTNANPTSSSPISGISSQKHRSRSPFRAKMHMQHRHKHVPLKERYGVDITPLSYLPGGRIERYLGNLNFFFIRESTSIRENGGLSGFTHSFVTEILAIVRAHITALGGNAMVAFFMTQCVLLHSPHKNQGQCLINVGGDVVVASYYGDDKYQGNQNC